VGVPLLGPVVVSGVVILMWISGNPEFQPSIPVMLDVSPWALVFFTLTLLGGTLNELSQNRTQHPTLNWSLEVTALAVGIYAAFIVIWRHNANWHAGQPVYVVTIILLVISVFLSHLGYAATRGRK